MCITQKEVDDTTGNQEQENRLLDNVWGDGLKKYDAGLKAVRCSRAVSSDR
ncbi:MAG UNVERIFIED_CONTAM: hypothetical protein LVR29_11480 [Microcystis novacekii LVE1205-3]